MAGRAGARALAEGVRPAGAARPRGRARRHPRADHGRGLGRELVRLDQDPRHARFVAAPQARRGRRRPAPPDDRPRRGPALRALMRRRLIVSTALISLAAVIVLGVPLGAVEAARLRQDAESRLEREADAVAGAVDDRVERHQTVPPCLLRRYAPSRHRIVVVPRHGPAIVTRPPIAGEVLRAHAGTSGVVRAIAEASVGELNARVHRAWLLIAALSAGGV